MNSKKKHKNRPKANVNPPKAETEVQLEEKNDDVLTKSDLKEETLVPVTEVPPPVVESAEPESDTPKKPKRNKGKKKNQFKEILEEDVKETTQSESSPNVDPSKDAVIEIKEQDEDKLQVDTSIAPNARKKKNKKKSQEQSTPHTNIPEKESFAIAIEEKKEELKKIDSEIKECQKEEEKSETKNKKKNKKKKRTDSEKSDRSEEVTCTSAFQQFLIGDDKPIKEETEVKPSHTPEENIISMKSPEQLISENVAKTCEVVKEENIKDCTVIKDIIEVAKDDAKNKKKNKKDKKHSHGEQQKESNDGDQKESILEIKHDLGFLEPIKQEHFEKESCMKLSLDDTLENKQAADIIEPMKSGIEKELSPKPKAKIAKPVEKKRKSHQETLVTDDVILDSENQDVAKEKNATKEISPLPQVNIETREIIESCSDKIELLNVPENTPMKETIQVSNSKVKDKKRKKSPKPQKKEAKLEMEEDTEQNVMQLNIEEEFTAEKNDKLNKSKCEKENVDLNESVIPLQTPEKTEIITFDDVPPLLKIDETHVPENKSGKKKKKTPKVPVSTEVLAELPHPEINEMIDYLSNSENLSESVSAPFADIEIRSVKTDESEGSSYDVTPDIHFTRSSSHQVFDDNNNMTIHEIRNVEGVKQSDPFIEPLVQGSGETPSTTPDVVSGIQMSGNKTAEKEEPTYLKSKMMEVNQDMEELRLSIERSLAEFSAMEKSEEKAEKEYEAHRLECEKTFAGVGESASPKPGKKKQTPEDVQMNLPEELEKTATLPFDIAKSTPEIKTTETPPVCPARKDNKGKNKNKKKGKQESANVSSPTSTSQSETTTSTDTKDSNNNKQEKTEKTESTENKGKQQSNVSKNKGKQQSGTLDDKSNIETQKTEMLEDSNKLSVSEPTFSDSLEQLDFAPIDNFEDALTSSIDDVNKTFELIVSDVAQENQKNLAENKPEINITAPVDETKIKKERKDEKVNPVSQPKNFLGQTDIPAQSNRTDYKKEKNKAPNERQAKVKIKDATEIEAKKQSKECQTDLKRAKKMIDKTEKETFSRVKNDNEEYVYKYSFRKVFLQSVCHVCHKDLLQMRVPCGYCNLVFYCGAKHKDEDWTQHQSLCFAISTIAHLKDQKHIYADAQNITGQEYRLLRMQMIVSCEKVLKRRLVPWEQEAMLYPRVCADVACREWRQAKLKDCEGCGQVSFCSDQPAHLPKSHQRWCKSYMLYAKLVGYQQTRGRLEPKMPTRVMSSGSCSLPEKMNDVLAAIYEEKIDMNDIQYAALTQLATAPLSAAHCYQVYKNKTNYSNGVHKKQSFTIHVVGAELQFEADALNKWEVFFLHLSPDVEELRVALISPELNPGDLPLDLLGKVRLCDDCRQNKRRVVFSFQDKKNYFEYRSSEDFVSPDLVCAFNPSIQRSSVYNGKDPWPATINCIIKQRTPFVITGYSITELRKDIARIKDCSEADFRVISEPVFNNFASVRPDRNFISDDDMPLLFKNYCVAVLCGC